MGTNQTVQLAALIGICLLTTTASASAAIPSQRVKASAQGQASDRVLFSFGNGYGVQNPTALTRGADGTYYGVGMAAAGALFRVTADGEESVVFDFGGYPTYPFGSNPTTIFQGSDGNFYGTTTTGAVNVGGVIFKVTPDGVGSALHSFDAISTDGSQPSALIQGSDGNLYGVAAAGGLYGAGTLFEITPSGQEIVLYAFGKSQNAARNPNSLIQAADGNFYGTLQWGNSASSSDGAVFKVTPNGDESTLFAFKSFEQGMWPDALIQAADGNLYGLTKSGGANGEGTLFKLTTSGSWSVVYSFGSTSEDAAGPSKIQQGADGNFYGVAGGGHYGKGAIFEVKPDGTESVLYAFQGNEDGQFPTSIAYAPEALYGVTDSGGQYDSGVFFSVLHPPLPPDDVMALPSGGAVSLQWAASISASSYQVFMGTKSENEAPSPVQSGIIGTTTRISGLKDDTTYYFTVVAVNDAGSSDMSTETSVTTQSPGGAAADGGGTIGLESIIGLLAIFAFKRRRLAA